MLGEEFMEISTRGVSVSAFAARRVCMPRDMLEWIGNKSKSDFLPTVNIRLINLRGSADDCAYKSSAIGLAARAKRGWYIRIHTYVHNAREIV